MDISIKKLRVFLDINETLIRTGEVNDSFIKAEANELIEFRKNCQKLAQSLEAFELIFLTGNSFEYSRRIEEPLGIKNISDLSFIIISENGLISRSFTEGDLWKLQVTNDYNRSINTFNNIISSSGISYYTQGNEIRYTLKPSSNSFTKKEISKIRNVAEKCELNKHAEIYVHQFYIDIDPKIYLENGNVYPFRGKYEAVNRLILTDNTYFNIAIGDSQSDIPMYAAVVEGEGKAYWVSNSLSTAEFPKAKLLKHSFTKGVNELLKMYINKI